MAGHAGGDLPLRHAHAIAKERHFLVADRNDDLQWTFRHLAETHILLLGLGFFLFRGRVRGRGRNADLRAGIAAGGAYQPSYQP